MTAVLTSVLFTFSHNNKFEFRFKMWLHYKDNALMSQIVVQYNYFEESAKKDEQMFCIIWNILTLAKY